jgi:phospholipase C
MGFITRILLLVFLAATFAAAQTNLYQQVQHVIVVIQENRTPDNLFQQDQTLINNGAHIASSGSCYNSNGNEVNVPLQPVLLGTCWDTYHTHADWNSLWHNGGMDGGCQVRSKQYCSGAPPQCPANQGLGEYCPAMTYARDVEWDTVHSYYILDPYFQVANQYGWANYMFQTNQGPSFPAHQFLFSGTSQPLAYNDPQVPCGPTYPCYQWFDGENTEVSTNGCIANHTVQAKDIDPASGESYSYTPDPPVNSLGFPCYDHPSLPTLLDSAGVTWKYYARSATDLWNAPTAINPICQTTGYGDQGGVCNGPDWINNVGAVIPTPGGDQAPILTDITTNCSLAQVSWVIPDGNWSDHQGGSGGSAPLPGDGGPSWIAAIVNGIGQSPCTDMINGKPVSYWDDTVILITWDDWGGLYDDVSPATAAGGPGIGYANSGVNPPNGVQYVYGFRVPLLVVSAYAKPSYISGSPSQGEVAPYIHDFGSILNFIEYAFGTGQEPLGGTYGIGDQHWPYADYFAPDGHFEYPSNKYSLFDFFNFNQIQTPTFTPITGAKYGTNCFHTPLAQGCFTKYPVDPDDDATESD